MRRRGRWERGKREEGRPGKEGGRGGEEARGGLELLNKYLRNFSLSLMAWRGHYFPFRIMQLQS